MRSSDGLKNQTSHFIEQATDKVSPTHNNKDINLSSAAFLTPRVKLALRYIESCSFTDTDSFKQGKSDFDLDCLHTIFEQQVTATPDNIALECADRKMTYRQVEIEANRMANYLRQSGVIRGTFVGISMERSEWSIISILAVLKAGGAYVPIEPSLPDDRIRYISEESDFVAVITDKNNKHRIKQVSKGQIVVVDDYRHVAHRFSDDLPELDAWAAYPEDICYVLFTSGTTGRPKGVVTEHRNAFHFVHAFNEACSTTSEDRVYQGFSLGFDGSVEEMWMAFSNGATLVCGESHTPKFGIELGQFLDEQRITFFSTVPTLLSTFTYDLPSLRQLVVSGEACHPDIVERWATSRRTMLNVYGPTEATVNTTASVLEKGKPVTIGRPLNGYDIHILDTDMKPVAEGEKGELYVSGPSISRGYLNQPELTDKTYVDWEKPYDGDNVLALKPQKLRLYKTGDLVRWNDEGELEFFGRIDSQVKLRGFRVELSEIEAVLLEQEEVSAVTVQVCDHKGMQTLVGYILLDEGVEEIDRNALLETLKDRLPTYMVPSFLDVLEEFPRLASGKVDRKQLPDPKDALIAEIDIEEDNSSELEKDIAEIWAKHFTLPAVGVEQNFFTDLGGHSLLAAQVAGSLFEKLGQKISVRDLYRYPTVRKLAYIINKQAQEGEENSNSALSDFPRVSAKWPWWTVAIQIVYFLTIIPILALPLVFILPLGLEVLQQQASVLEFSVKSLAVFGATWMGLIFLAIATKWLLIGKYRPGVYPLWGSFYIRWWIVSRLQFLSALSVFNGTPVAALIWRAMGAKVGKGCHLNASLVYAWDCISLGDNVSIGVDTQMPALRVEKGYLVVGDISVGNRCFIGCHSTLGMNIKMEDGARLDDQSLLPDGFEAEKNAQYRGSPPEHATVPVPQGQPVQWSTSWLVAFALLQIALGSVSVLAALAPVFLASWVVALTAIHQSAFISVPVFLAAVPLTLIVFAFWAAFLRKVVRPSPKSGVYELYSFKYLQHWLASLLMQVIKTVCLSVFTTLYLPPLMRLLGARLGEHTEMSTVWRIDPEMVSAGDGVFFADGCMMGVARTHGGRFEVGSNSIGNNSFIGNSAILSTGNDVGNDCLLGVLSAVPDQMEAIPDESDWLGSPSFQLPNRQKTFCFDKDVTYRPTRSLYLQRAAIDTLRVLLPGYILGGLGVLSLLIILAVHESYGLAAAYTAVPLLAWLGLAVCLTVVVGLKWLIMGAFKPVVVPLWCRYVWWNEFINGLYESLMSPWIANFFGTPFASMLLRLMGCKIGKYCYIETDLFSEFDLVEVGDHSALNAGVIIQNHLFEDRIMKSSYVRIKEGCSVGNMSVVLYDSVMEKGATLGQMSLLMKGETISENKNWYGIPTSS